MRIRGYNKLINHYFCTKYTGLHSGRYAGFITIRRHDINWDFVVYLNKLSTDFDEALRRTGKWSNGQPVIDFDGDPIQDLDPEFLYSDSDPWFFNVF